MSASCSSAGRYGPSRPRDWRNRELSETGGATGKLMIVAGVVEFTDERRAVTFERCLKSGLRGVREEPFEVTASRLHSLCPIAATSTDWRRLVAHIGTGYG